MSGTIIAAVITSLVAAGSTAATIVAGELKSSGSWVGGVIVNETDYSFSVTSYQPNHGHWWSHPNHTVSSVAHIIDMLRAEAVADNGGNPVSDSELLKYYRDHYIKTEVDQPFVKSAVTTWEMSGANLGSEGLIRLHLDAGTDIYFLIRKIPAGDYGAGISIVGPDWVKSEGFSVDDDSDGSKFCKHIRESSNSGPSSYFSTGQTIKAKNGPVEIEFSGGQTTKFTIRKA